MFTARAFAATTPRPRSPPPAFPGAIPGPTTWTWRSCIAGSATPTCTWCATSGRGGPPSIRFVPGHEIVGRVRKVGANVTSVKPGDMAAVGCMVGPAGRAAAARTVSSSTATRAGRSSPTTQSDADGTAPVTYGGYSDGIVVNSHFVLRVSPKLDPAAAAPLLCAGITLYSPLKHWGAGPGKKVGIVGLGGSATWASSSHTRLARTRCCSRRRRRRLRMASGWARMTSSCRRTPTRWRSTCAAST